MTEQASEPRSTAKPSSINVNTLGYFLDGWADLIEGMGGNANNVHVRVFKQLKGRNMPGIQTSLMKAYVSVTSSERRTYTINTTSPGATTTVYIGDHGKDLYTSWRTFIHPVLNQTVLLIALGISAVLGLVTGGIRQSGGVFGPQETSFSLMGWILATVGFAILAAIVLALAGRILKGDWLGYVFIQPNVFDAEDITAMSLSAHKSLLRALDETGIDVTKLRLKSEFKGGRRGEIV